MITKRVLKKISTPFEEFNPDGAILIVNMFDPQIFTLKVFLEAISEARLPSFVVGNKLDLIKNKKERVREIEKQLGKKIVPAALLKNEGLEIIKKRIGQTFKPKAKIAVLGIFNSGKTTLISKLTGKKLKISDLPGTTLEFTPYRYRDWTLIDTVGQLIDVNKPMMVSIDLTGCKTIEEKIARVFRQEADGILATLETAVPQVKKVVQVLKTQLQKGKKLVVTGAGASALVAMEMAGQSLETGVPAFVFTNNLADAQPISFAKGALEEEMGLSKYIVQAVNPGDIMIGVSASGGTGFVYDAMRRARKKKAITIAITENIDTPLGKAADYIVKSNAKPEGPSSSRVQVAHLAIVHAILLTLADERGITAEESIKYMLPEKVATKKMGIK